MEDFVTFELAVKLKEKGFIELCLAYYTNDDTLYYNYSHKQGPCYRDCYLSHNLMPKDSVSGKFIDAPTTSQVLKWLREEKKIHINVSIYRDTSEDADGRIIEEWCFWNWDIQNCDSGDVLQDGDDIEYESYEQAALAGIEYVLDNLIQKE